MVSTLSSVGSQLVNLLFQPNLAPASATAEELAAALGERLRESDRPARAGTPTNRLATFAANYALERGSAGPRLPSMQVISSLRGTGIDYRAFMALNSAINQANAPRTLTGTPISLPTTPPDTAPEPPPKPSLADQIRGIIANAIRTNQNLSMGLIESGLFDLSARRVQQDGNLTEESPIGVRYDARENGSLYNIGVLSSGQNNTGRQGELEYDPTRRVSEELVVRLNGYATSASADISRFYNNEGGGGQERGQYLLYRGETLVGVNTFEAQANTNGNQRLTIDAGAGGVFDRIVFRALPYGQGGQTTEQQGRDSSDFTVDSVQFNVLDSRSADQVAQLLTVDAARRQQLILAQAQTSTTSISALQPENSGISFEGRIVQTDGRLSVASSDYVGTLASSNWGSGIGVTGRTDSQAGTALETGYNPTLKLSEQLIVSFDRLAQQAKIDLSAFYPNESGGGIERGQYEVYRGETLVGVGTFSASSSTGKATLSIGADDENDPLGGLFDRIVLSALPYGGGSNNAQAQGRDSSDFLVSGVSVDWLDQASSDLLSALED